MLVKKYTNRRLYDTEESRYVTLEELAEKIRAGKDATVVDARTGEDLTQATLTQIIMESRGAARILPVPLLVQLIRMGDDALGEFMGVYMGQALDAYLSWKRTAQSIRPLAPLTALPFAATSALARLLLTGLGDPASPALNTSPGATASDSEPPPEAPQAASASDVATLRRELDELRREVQRKRK